MNFVSLTIFALAAIFRCLLSLRPSLVPVASQRREVTTFLHWILGSGLVAFLVMTFGVRLFYVPSRSMEPTLEVRDLFVVNRLAYWMHPPHIGDIAVFRPLEQQVKTANFMVKRIVASGGDTVEIVNGKLFRNGRAVNEGYLAPGQKQGDMPKFEVPSGHYFVMGDNRVNSSDSRAWRRAIPQSHFLGTAWVILLPISRVGGIYSKD